MQQTKKEFSPFEAYTNTVDLANIANLHTFNLLLEKVFKDYGEDYADLFCKLVYEKAKTRLNESPEEVLALLVHIIESKLPDNNGEVFELRLNSLKSAKEIKNLLS